MELILYANGHYCRTLLPLHSYFQAGREGGKRLTSQSSRQQKNKKTASVWYQKTVDEMIKSVACWLPVHNSFKAIWIWFCNLGVGERTSSLITPERASHLEFEDICGHLHSIVGRPYHCVLKYKLLVCSTEAQKVVDKYLYKLIDHQNNCTNEGYS